MKSDHKTGRRGEAMPGALARKSGFPPIVVLAGLCVIGASMNPSAAALAADGTTSGGADLCRLLTKTEVSRVLKITIVRAEALQTQQAGCEFSAKGSLADAGAGHYAELAKSNAAAHGTTIDGPTEQLIQSFAKGVFQGSDAEKSSTAAARHAGETPVFTFAIQPGDAEDQMQLNRRTMAGLSPKSIKTVVGLGDESFDSGGAMLTVRKGTTMIVFTYKSCTCTTNDVVPLARKVVDAL